MQTASADPITIVDFARLWYNLLRDGYTEERGLQTTFLAQDEQITGLAE